MTKIERIDAELLKAREKAAEVQARIRTLEGQKAEEENALIVQMVRKVCMTPAELGRFLERNKHTLANPNRTPPITADIIKRESEDNSQ